MTSFFRNTVCMFAALGACGCELEFFPDETDENEPSTYTPPEVEPHAVELSPYARTIAAAGFQTCALYWDGDDSDQKPMTCWGPGGGMEGAFQGWYSEVSAGQSEAGTDWGLCALGIIFGVCFGGDSVGYVAEDVAHIGAGSRSTQCFQSDDGTLGCYGLDEYDLPESVDVDVIIGQGESFCGLKLDEAPVCWGAPLPQNPISDRVAFISEGAWCEIENGAVNCSEGVDFELDASNAFQISAGPEMVCVLDESGALSCDGTTRALVNLPSESARFVEIAVGQAHACGIEKSGEFFCWGTWLVDSEEVPAAPPSDVKAF